MCTFYVFILVKFENLFFFFNLILFFILLGVSNFIF